MDNGQPTKVRVDADGVRVERSGVRVGVWLTVLALALVGALLVFGRPARRGSEGATAAAPPASKIAPEAPGRVLQGSGRLQLQHPQPAAPAAPLPSGLRLVPKAAIGPSATVEPVEAEPAEPASTSAEEEKPAANEMGENQPSGIAVFPPPGTKPILRGFVVPGDFPVPEGYVKHYQTTDRGRQLPPILMFHPDYALVDQSGQPIAMPKDRVVPRELLPAGMPDQLLEVPAESSEEAPGAEAPAPNPGGRGASR